jgi:transcriptional regulator with PAS, ATPase and Fis domain
VRLPALFKQGNTDTSFASEREIMYKILFDMKADMNDLKKLVLQVMQTDPVTATLEPENQSVFSRLFKGVDVQPSPSVKTFDIKKQHEDNIQDTEEVFEESLSIVDKEIELIKKALDKHNGKRKLAADELGISERTLYRKIKEYNLE